MSRVSQPTEPAVSVDPGSSPFDAARLQLNIQGFKIQIPGMKLTLEGESDHEWQTSFDQLLEEIYDATGDAQSLETLVSRCGNELLVHAFPMAGQRLLTPVFPPDRELPKRLIETRTPEVQALVTQATRFLAEEWDRTVARFGPPDEPLPVSLERLEPPGEGEVDHPKFSVWLKGLVDSQRGFVVAERHANPGATHFLTANMARFANHTLFTEGLCTEYQPVMDAYLADPDPTTPLPPLLAAHRDDVRAMFVAAKAHGVSVVGINSELCSEYKLPGECDYHQRGRAMNQLAFDVMRERCDLKDRDAPPRLCIIHCGLGHGKFGDPGGGNPRIHGVGSVVGLPTVLFEESGDFRNQPGKFYLTTREFDDSRVIQPEGPPGVATHKYDLRVWKMVGDWTAALTVLKIPSVEESSSSDDEDIPAIDYANYPHYRWDDRLDEWVSKDPSIDETDSSDEDPP